MHSIALGFGRLYWQRHRLGLVACLSFLAAAIALCWGLGREGLHPGVLGGMSLPLVAGIVYLLAIFSFGFEADLEVRESCYPARMFTLPASTRALAGWPMLLGGAAVGLWWLAIVALVWRRYGLEVPLVWTTLLAASMTAWVQVVLFVPYRLPWLRLAIGGPLLLALLVGSITAWRYGAAEWAIAAALGVSLPIAYASAVAGLSRARHSVGRPWRFNVERLAAAGGNLIRRRRPFASGFSAQVWCELRRHGLSLPVQVLFYMPAMAFLLAIAEPQIIPPLFIVAAYLPVLAAGSAGTSVRKSNPWVRDYYGVPPFHATRPITSGAMVGAKLLAAGISALLAWGLTLMLLTPVLLSDESRAALAHAWRSIAGSLSSAQSAAAIALIAICTLTLIWKRIVTNLYLGLTGREWVIKGSIVLDLTIWTVGVVVGLGLLRREEFFEPLILALPWIAGALGAIKLAGAMAAWAAIWQKRLLSAGTVRVALIGWIAIAALLFVTVRWLVPGEVPSRYLALGVFLLLPLLRVSLGPLALDWNRHR